MKNQLSHLLIILLLSSVIAGCSTPAEKAEKYYEKGMALIDTNPDKAQLEFQNALQLKKNMIKAVYGLGLVAERKGDLKATFSLMNEVVEQEPTNIDALVKTGQILLAAGKLDIALERSNRALAIDKNNISALNLRSALQLKLHDPEGAIKYAKEVLAKDANNQDAYVLLASERLAAKDNVKALEFLDKALAKKEKNLAVQFIRIKVLENLSMNAEADTAFQKSIKLFPDKTIVRKSYAQFLMKADKKADAEVQLREIVKSTPNDIQPKLDVIRFLIATKNQKSGSDQLEVFVKEEPENYALAFALVNLYQIQKNSVAEDALLAKIAKNAIGTTDGYKAQGQMAYKLIRSGKKDEAKKMLDLILEEDKTNTQALTFRAGLAMEAKDYDSAIIDLRTVIRDSPEALGAAIMLAKAHESLGSFELAEEHYLKAYDTSKFSAIYGIPYTQFLLRRKNTERAGKIYEQMLDTNPNDVNVIRNYAQFKIAKNDFVGAQALSDKAKKIDVNNPLGDQIEGAISANKNDVDATVNAFKRAHTTAPNDTQPIAAVVNTYMRAGKSKEAIAFIESVVKDNPKNMEAKLMQGQLYASVGKEQDAQQTFSQAIELQPKNTAGYQQLALTQKKAGQLIEAEKTIAQGLAIDAKDFGLKLTQAGLYETSNRIDEAIKVYEEMIIDRPDSEIVANNLVSLISDHRNDQSTLNRAYNLVKPFKLSEVPQFLDTHGWISFRVGKFVEAEKSLKQATEKMPEVAIFHYHLAKVYMAQNNPESAKQALQNAVKYAKNQPFEKLEEATELLKTL